MSDSDEEADVKKEKKDASDIKQDPDIEMTQERMETLEEFKARYGVIIFTRDLNFPMYFTVISIL